MTETFGAYAELSEPFPGLVEAVEALRELPGREDLELTGIYLGTGRTPQGLNADQVAGNSGGDLREVARITVREHLDDKDFDIEYVLVFDKKEEEYGDAGNEDGSLTGPGDEEAPEESDEGAERTGGEGFPEGSTE